MANKETAKTAKAIEKYSDRITLSDSVNAENFDFSTLPAKSFTLTIETKTNKGDTIKNKYVISTNGNKTLTINSVPVNDKSRELLTKSLTERERLSNTLASSVSSDTCKVYRYYLSLAKAKDKKERFEKSGVKFMYKGEELRFLPKHAIDTGCEFILFKSISGDATLYLERNNDTFTYGILAKGGRAKTLKGDIVELTKGLLLKLMNDTFNGLTWSEVIDLCKAVEKFGTCSVPKALKA